MKIKLSMRDALIFVFFTGIILALNAIPTFLFINHAPIDRYYPLLHNNSQDYYFYLSLMREGGNGSWLTSIPFTTETHAASLVFTFFLILGKIGHVLSISYEWMYFYSRIVFSLLFFISAFLFIRKLKFPYPNFTYIVFLFASPLLRTVLNDNGDYVTAPFLNWWTGVDPIRRASYLPHHMFGGLLLIISFHLFLQVVEKKMSLVRSVIISIFLFMLMLFVHTPSLLLYGSVTCCLLVVLLIISFSKKTINPGNFIPFIFPIAALILMGLLAVKLNSDPLWNHALSWEKTLQLPFFKEIWGGFGLLLPFTIPGLTYTLKHRDTNSLFASLWFFVPIILIPLAPIFGISNTRLVQGIPYLAFSLLISYGLKETTYFLNHFEIKNSPFFKKISLENLFLILVFFAFAIQSSSTIIWSYKDQIREYWGLYSNIYLDKKLFDGFNFINSEFPKNTVTLSTFYTGNFLPAFTNTVSYIGHFGYTYNLQAKEPVVNQFFRGQLSDNAAADFLKNNSIKAVIQTNEEKGMTNSELYPILLKKVFSNTAVTIYKTL